MLLVLGIMLAMTHKTFAGVQTHFRVDSNTLQIIEQQNLLEKCAEYS